MTGEPDTSRHGPRPPIPERAHPRARVDFDHAAAEPLRLSHAEFEDALQLLHGLHPADAILTLDDGGTIVAANPGAERVFGVPGDRLLGRAVGDVLSDVAGPPGPSGPCEVRVRRGDGEGAPVELTVTPVELPARRVYLALVREQGSCTQLEEPLRAATERLRFHWERTPLACITVDRRLRITDWNPAAEQVFGYTPAEAAGQHVLELIVPADARKDVEPVAAELQRGVRISHKINDNLTKDGRRITCEWFNASLHDGDGRVSGFICMGLDITERLAVQEERLRFIAAIQQAQKMESLGLLAGGVAHDFNNILGVILGNAEEALDADLRAVTPAAHSVEQIVAAARRGKALTRTILMFATGNSAIREPVVVNRVVTETLGMLRASLPNAIRIRQEVAADPCYVRADPTELAQVVMNLCNNAGHAMLGAGGELWVKLGRIELPERLTGNVGAVAAGPAVRLEVSDTGAGIDPADIGRIFDPYFTRKDTGEGCGLGLAVVRGIVKTLGGAIRVDSTPGAGATFTVYLPREPAPAATAAPAPSAHPAREPALLAGARILVVDDEEPLLDLHQRVLAACGSDVVGCTTGEEALARFRDDDGRFDLVVTDQAMPGLCGTDLATQIHALRPGTPVIVCTGYGNRLPPDAASEHHLAAVLRKPVAKEELISTLTRVLAGAGEDRGRETGGTGSHH